MIEKNVILFEEIRALNLPLGEYLITASGPMGIRMLREIGDIDIKVSDELWEKLAEDNEIVYDDCNVMKIKLSENVEVMCEASFEGRNPDAPKIDQQLREAEIIDDLPFENIQTTLFFKRKSTREKDLNDVELIEKWLAENR
jgi:hypothetical protein